MESLLIKWVINFLFIFVLLCIPVLYEFWGYKKRKVRFWIFFLEKYGFYNFKLKYLLYGFLLSFVLFGVNFLFIYLTSLFTNDLSSANNLLTYSQMPIIFIIYMFLSAFAEELFFRAFLTRYLGIFISSILFAGLHFAYGSYTYILGTFILGLLLAFIWKKTNNIYLVFTAHLLQNLYTLLFLLLL